MRQRQLLISLLVAAILLVDNVALRMIVGPDGRGPAPYWPHPALILLGVLALSQVSLLAIWAALGRTPAPWRLLGMILGVSAWSGLLASTEYSGDLLTYRTTPWTVRLLAQTLVVLGPLSIARSLGVGLVDLLPGDRARDRGLGRPRLQFSLGYLLSWMTSLAVVLGLLRCLVHYAFLPRDWSLLSEIAELSFGAAAIGISALWTALGTRVPLARVAVFCMSCAAAISAHYWWLRATGIPSPLVHCGIFILQAILVLAVLWVFRVAGYRWGLVRK